MDGAEVEDILGDRPKQAASLESLAFECRDEDRVSGDEEPEVDGDLEALLEETNQLLDAIDPPAKTAAQGQDHDEANVDTQRERMLRLAGASKHQKEHEREQRSELEEDAEWIPMQLPELLSSSTNATLERFHAKKWREIHQLYLLLESPCFRAVRISGNDRALFETFSRAFPHNMVTKARFSSVLRLALGIRHDVGDVRPKQDLVGTQNEQTRADHVALAQHLDKLKYCCERGADNVPMLHWRTLLVGLHMFQEPLLPMREQLQWAFSVFASTSGYLELKPARATGKTNTNITNGGGGGIISIGDLSVIFTHALRNPSAAAFVSDRVRAALALVPTPTAPLKASRFLEEVQQLLQGTSSRITRSQFRCILKLPPVRSLLRHGVTTQVTSIDAASKSTLCRTISITSPHTSVLDELCSSVYRSHVFKARRREHNVRAIQRLRYYIATRMLRSCFAVWAKLAYRQARARARLIRVSSAIAKKRKHRAFDILKKFCVASIAAVEIQRIFRGYRGRMAWSAQWARVQAALKVQGAFRMRSHLNRFVRELRRRNQMAVRIQRVFRGRQGRILARKALLDLYYREMLVIHRKRQAFYELIRNELAKRIQRAMRHHLSERIAQRKREEAFARRKIEHEMEENLAQAQRDLRRHRHDIATEYERIRIDHEQRQQRKKIDDAEKQKIVRRRRQREWDALRADRVARQEALKKSAEDAYGELKREWSVRIEDRGRGRASLVIQLLALDDKDASNLSPEYRTMRLQFKKRVKERAQELATKYKAANAVVPKREVDERAQADIVDQEVESAREEATSEWLHAEAHFLHQLDEEEEQRELQANEQLREKRVKSAVKVQSAFRMFAARKVLRDQVRARVVKEFDPKTRQPIYRNTFTGEASVRKPLTLGTEELSYRDQWFVLQDPVTGDGFFYNPCSMRQSWDLPEECRTCEPCTSSCTFPAFADFWDSASERFVCQACAQQFPRFDQLVAYDGSRRNGGVSPS